MAALDAAYLSAKGEHFRVFAVKEKSVERYVASETDKRNNVSRLPDVKWLISVPIRPLNAREIGGLFDPALEPLFFSN